MKSLVVVIGLLLCLVVSTVNAQAIRNPTFASDLNGWLTCYENPASGQLTPGSVTWDPAYGGSARMEVDGAPSAIGLCQPTCDTLFPGDSVWVDVNATDMGNFAGVHLIIGDGVGNGQQVDLQAPPGDHHIVIYANKMYPQGTFYWFTMTAWPGACTVWVKTANASIVEEDMGKSVTIRSALSANPNPTTGHVSISLSLPQPCRGRLAVYDAAGNLVRELENRRFLVGQYTTVWSGRDNTGHAVSPGTYFVRLTTQDGREEVAEVVVTH